MTTSACDVHPHEARRRVGCWGLWLDTLRGTVATAATDLFLFDALLVGKWLPDTAVPRPVFVLAEPEREVEG